MLFARLLKPSMARIGFGLCLCIVSVSVWGSYHVLAPALSAEGFSGNLYAFLNIGCSWLWFALAFPASYYVPGLLRRLSLWASGPLIVLGWLPVLLPAGLLPQALAMGISAVFTGFGASMLLCAWFPVFCAQEAEAGTLGLLSAMAYSVLFRVIVALLTGPFLALVPLAAVPLSWGLLLKCARAIDGDLPMFSDVPTQHGESYRRAISLNWRTALYIGSLGFVCGLTRALALPSSMTGFVEASSLIGTFVSAFVLLFLWSRRSFKYSATFLFRLVYPFLVAAFCALPFIGGEMLAPFAIALYVMFSFASACILLQCAQTSRDFGINPPFVYGLMMTVVLLMQGGGFFLGTLAGSVSVAMSPFGVIAVASLGLFASVMYLTRGVFSSGARDDLAMEFIALVRDDPSSASSMAGIEEEEEKEVHYRDRLSKQCAAIARRYYLSSREAEVMELMARGGTVPSIAKTLYISENTVKTHTKRIYGKLDIHKREELLALFNG